MIGTYEYNYGLVSRLVSILRKVVCSETMIGSYEYNYGLGVLSS